MGTHGKRATEVGVDWVVGAALKARLEKEGLKVVMTKQSQPEVVKNRRRAEIANEAHADLMIRLHCDASNGSGYTVYYPAKAGTVKGFTGPSEDVMQSSGVAAKRVLAAMRGVLDGHLHADPLKTDAQTFIGGKQGGALTGSIFSKVPVVLVEMVVLTNPKDEAFITSKEGQSLMVEALAKGVLAALGK